jgi:hypothetical protein
VSENEYLAFEEADRFLRAAAPEWRTFLVVALKTGLRIGELLSVQRRDVDLVGHESIEMTCGTPTSPRREAGRVVGRHTGDGSAVKKRPRRTGALDGAGKGI